MHIAFIEKIGSIDVLMLKRDADFIGVGYDPTNHQKGPKGNHR